MYINYTNKQTKCAVPLCSFIYHYHKNNIIIEIAS